ncbi:MAG: AAA family ATPase [Verrucomicrobiota bacterium]|jgi:predicted ATPase
MITSIQFKNFKALRDATLPLSQFTLIVGPNGSGKSTVFKGLQELARPHSHYQALVTAGQTQPVYLGALWGDQGNEVIAEVLWPKDRAPTAQSLRNLRFKGGSPQDDFLKALVSCQTFSFDATVIASPVQLMPNAQMTTQGGNLAVVLDRLRDQNPERFEALNKELERWLPEFDRVLFETPSAGQRAICLRTSSGGYTIKASDLSQGSLIALAVLTLTYLPKPPPLVCFEEPDHGLHPRLLRDVHDAIYRLAYPGSFGEKREAVQVIATTHNPYFLDLFREHPEEIVIAEKTGLEAKFSRLSDRADLAEILGDAHLGDVWFSGVLGGVPAGT